MTTVPVKPSSARSRPVVIGALTVARAVGSRAGTSRCPVMTARVPAAIAAANGASSTARELARRERSTVATS